MKNDSRSYDVKHPGQGLGSEQPSVQVPGLLVFGYVCLIVYASVYPGTGWRSPDEPFRQLLALRWSRTDVIANFLAYVPLGLLLGWRYRPRLGVLGCTTLATLFGGFLSIGVESLQTLLPQRVPSLVDVLTNALGTAAGAVLANAFRRGSAMAARMRAAREEFFLPVSFGGVGFAALLLWNLSQWSPFVPSIDVGTIREGLSPLWRAIHDLSLFRPLEALAYGLNLLALGLIAASLLKPVRPLVVPFGAWASLVLTAKIFITGRAISIEALGGLICAMTGLIPASRLPFRMRGYTAVACLLAAFCVSEINSGSGPLHDFNWIPFAGEIENNLNGFANLLGEAWPFVALAYLAGVLTPTYMRREVRVLGALAIGVFSFALEWSQQFVPGRHGDVTVVILAAAAWLLAWQVGDRRS